MDNESKIREQFHYFNILADIDTVYGDWAVSTDGDVVNSVYPYAIMAIHFEGTDWLQVIRTKVWFKPEYEKTLLTALERAKVIIDCKKNEENMCSNCRAF